VQVRTDGPDQVGPESPSNLSAVPDETNFSKAVVRWSPSVRDADGGDLTGLAGYVVFRSKGTASSFVPVDTLGAEARAYVDTSLEELTTYFYTVSAIDDAGNESARASSVEVRTEGPDQVAPESPSNLSAVPDETDFGKAVVRWSPSVRDADGGDLTGLAGYVVFRSKGTANSFVPVDTLGAEAREYVDASLEELTTYFYTISAIDDAGNESARASSVQVRTEGPDQIAPEAPSNLSAVADEADFGRAVVRWSPSVRDADGGDLTGLVSYVVFRSKGTVNSFVPVDTLAATAREFEDLNLNLLTDYFYTVTALDAANNESARANPVQVRTEGPDQIAPATPQNVSAVPDGVDFGRVVVSWSPSVSDADGGDLTGLAGYVVFRSKGSVNAFVPMDTLSAASRQFEDSALESLTTYFYTLMAFDDSGNESSRSTAVQVLTDGPDQVAPAAPSDLAATADLSAAQITVSWSPSSTDADGSDLTGLSSYIVLRSKGDETAFAAIDTLNSASTSFVDTGLESSTTYFYAVRSIDDSGNASSRSSTISTKTAGISQLTGVAATGDIRQIMVTWTGSSEDRLLGYNVYRSTRSDQDYVRQTGVEGTSYTTGQTTYIDSGLTGGATFFYRVSVVTNAGESGLSAFAGTTADSDTRAPAAPTFVDGEPATGDPEQLSVTWKQPTTDLNGATLTGLSSYLIYRSTTNTGPFDLVGTSTTTAFTDTGLVAVTTYYYQIEASDQDGNLSNRSTTVALTTGGVDLPSNVRLSSSTPSNIAEAPTVTVRWNSSAGAILNYEVQRTTVANSTTDSDFTSITPNTLDTFRVDNTVSRGTTYYYRLRARDVDDRFSDWTALASVEVEN
jgi:fibronectin type 3 domain-containing protein